MNTRTLRSNLLLASVLFPSVALYAEIKPAKPFTSYMVLQRNVPVPVWGTADPGENVTVQFRDQTKATQAGADGKWRVVLDPLSVGSPGILSIGSQRFEDVLVGDVWVGSGQSNMDMGVKSYTAGDPTLAKLAEGTYPQLRLLRKDANAKWQKATPETNPEFSALLFSFGQPLQAELGVPIGLMVGAVGGTPSGFWLTENMFRADEACQKQVQEMTPSYNYEERKKKYDEELLKWQAAMDAWKKSEEQAKAAGKPPTRPPGQPQAVGRPGETNSGKMGQLFETFIRPYVGYAIRGVLWDQGESRTNVACVDQFTLMGALIKGWRKEWGQEFPFLYIQKPSGGGTAWDPAAPMHAQASKFSPQPQAIPNPPDPTYSHELHLRIRNYPDTHMVTSTDLGAGIHPALKSAYGERAAKVALGAVYGTKHAVYGPLYEGHKIEGSKIRVSFTHTGKGLAVRHADKLQGFLIAGEDKKFVWADAIVDGQTIVVSSSEVPAPKAVRYAWSGQFPWANLFNADGLPAQPFRTDAW